MEDKVWVRQDGLDFEVTLRQVMQMVLGETSAILKDANIRGNLGEVKRRLKTIGKRWVDNQHSIYWRWQNRDYKPHSGRLWIEYSKIPDEWNKQLDELVEVIVKIFSDHIQKVRHFKNRADWQAQWKNVVRKQVAAIAKQKKCRMLK